MVKLFSQLVESFDDFFKINFVTADGFKLTTKAKDFKGVVTVKGGKAALKAELEFETEVDSNKVKHVAKILSKGEHTLESTVDISKALENTSVKKEFNFNSNTHEYDLDASIRNTSITDTKLQANVHGFSDKHWTSTLHAATEITPSFKLSGDATYDGSKKEVNQLHYGVCYFPQNWIETFIAYSHEDKIDSDIRPWKTGVLDFRQRLKASEVTTLGFDYSYNLGEKTSSTTFGLETRLTDSVAIKSKVNSDGNIEASTILKVNDTWNLTVGAATHASTIGGKQEAQVGFALTGKL
jgi:hypothetical protein